jgi:hypothetical protein
MGEEGKFQHIDKWLGAAAVAYNASYSNISEACDAAEQSGGLSLFDRIALVDVVQNLWKNYSLGASNITAGISRYRQTMEEIGEEASEFAEAAAEKSKLVSSQMSGLRERMAALWELKKELTQQYLRQEGIIEGEDDTSAQSWGF